MEQEEERVSGGMAGGGGMAVVRRAAHFSEMADTIGWSAATSTKRR